MVSKKTLLMSLVRFLDTLTDEIEMGGWSMDWTDQRVLINTDLRLLFDALLKLLTQLPEYAILCIPEWISSDSFKLLLALDAEWIKVAKKEIESESIYFDVFIVSIGIPATRELILEWGVLRNLSMPCLSIEVLAALGSTLKKEFTIFRCLLMAFTLDCLH